MNLGSAVDRILEDLGNRTSTVVRARAVTRIQAAQRDFESGKSLPKFLIEEDAPLVLPVGLTSVALPTGFIRIATRPYYFPLNSTKPTFLNPQNDFQMGAEAFVESDVIEGPQSFIVRKTTINFFNPAAATTNFVWSYYKHATVLSGDSDTNAWLSDEGAGADWLIGEAGWRLAMSLRDKEGVQIFTALRQSGRAATFGELLAQEDDSGPLIMGANL